METRLLKTITKGTQCLLRGVNPFRNDSLIFYYNILSIDAQKHFITPLAITRHQKLDIYVTFCGTPSSDRKNELNQAARPAATS